MNETITSVVQALTVAESDREVKFDQETSIADVKNTLMGELLPLCVIRPKAVDAQIT